VFFVFLLFKLEKKLLANLVSDRNAAPVHCTPYVDFIIETMAVTLTDSVTCACSGVGEGCVKMHISAHTAPALYYTPKTEHTNCVAFPLFFHLFYNLLYITMIVSC